MSVALKNNENIFSFHYYFSNSKNYYIIVFPENRNLKYLFTPFYDLKNFVRYFFKKKYRLSMEFR